MWLRSNHKLFSLTFWLDSRCYILSNGKFAVNFIHLFYFLNMLVALRKNFDCHPLTYGGGCNDIHGARSVF